MKNYEAIVNNIYHFIWTEMNKLDVEIANSTSPWILEARREAYWNVLAHLDPVAAADRIKSYDEREKFAETMKFSES